MPENFDSVMFSPATTVHISFAVSFEIPVAPTCWIHGLSCFNHLNLIMIVWASPDGFGGGRDVTVEYCDFLTYDDNVVWLATEGTIFVTPPGYLMIVLTIG